MSDRVPLRFNIMVVGESNLGKTTCLETILENFWHLDGLTVAETGLCRRTSPAYIPNARTVRISEIGVVAIKNGEEVLAYVHVYDSPGYGDDIDNKESFDIIRDDLVRRHRAHNDLYTSGGMTALSEYEKMQKDERIHCCLYFISPHRMKKIDEEFIKYIADVVLIVPVIAKSDTMTMDERRLCLLQTKQRLTLIDREMMKSHQFRATFNFQVRKQDGYASTKQFKLMPIDELKGIIAQSLEPKQNESIPLDVEKTRVPRDNCNYNEFSDEEDEDPHEPHASVETRGSPVSTSFDMIFPTTDVETARQPCSDTASQAESANVEILDEYEDTYKCNDGSKKKIFRVANIYAIVADPSGERAYRWGTCNTKSAEDSDFPLLQEHLFSRKTIRSMIDWTAHRTGKLIARLNTEVNKESVTIESPPETQCDVEFEEENRVIVKTDPEETSLVQKVVNITDQILLALAKIILVVLLFAFLHGDITV